MAAPVTEKNSAVLAMTIAADGRFMMPSLSW
jgi:hypothetical protein